MKISIIIPTKNEEKVIEKALKQYLPFKKKFGIELIVSDGGSTDKTIEIAKKYADRVIVKKKGEIQNIAGGRNAGAKVAKGDLLFHTDADVIIQNKKEFFKRVLEVFENKNFVALTTNLKIYPEEEKLEDKIAHFLINTSIKTVNKLGLSFFGKGECQIVRASAFKKINGYKIQYFEDCRLFYALKKHGKIAYLGDLVIYHSPRRFRKKGYLGLLAISAVETIYILLKGKASLLKDWEPVR